jgi:hypothetical protein
MEQQMQPLAIGALVIGAVMVLGVAVTLILTRRSTKPRSTAEILMPVLLFRPADK